MLSDQATGGDERTFANNLENSKLPGPLQTGEATASAPLESRIAEAQRQLGQNLRSILEQTTKVDLSRFRRQNIYQVRLIR